MMLGMLTALLTHPTGHSKSKRATVKQARLDLPADGAFVPNEKGDNRTGGKHMGTYHRPRKELSGPSKEALTVQAYNCALLTAQGVTYRSVDP